MNPVFALSAVRVLCYMKREGNNKIVDRTYTYSMYFNLDLLLTTV